MHLRAKDKRSKWSQQNTPGVSDPPENTTSNESGTAPRMPRGMRESADYRDLVSRAADIVKGRNLDRHGIYEVDLDYVSKLSYEQLLKIVTEQ
jgi:hypothetical protein